MACHNTFLQKSSIWTRSDIEATVSIFLLRISTVLITIKFLDGWGCHFNSWKGYWNRSHIYVLHWICETQIYYAMQCHITQNLNTATQLCYLKIFLCKIISFAKSILSSTRNNFKANKQLWITEVFTWYCHGEIGVSYEFDSVEKKFSVLYLLSWVFPKGS